MRSRAGAFPHGSISTAPTALHFTTSPPARSRARASGACTSVRRSGSIPNSASPGACRWPIVRHPRSSRSHRIGCVVGTERIASSSAKPAAVVMSSGSAAKHSCSAARAIPPPSRASIFESPSATRAPSFTAKPVSLARKAARGGKVRLICSSYVPTLPDSSQCPEYRAVDEFPFPGEGPGLRRGSHGGPDLQSEALTASPHAWDKTGPCFPPLYQIARRTDYHSRPAIRPQLRDQ